jgi:hypothetical protein
VTWLPLEQPDSINRNAHAPIPATRAALAAKISVAPECALDMIFLTISNEG